MKDNRLNLLTRITLWLCGLCLLGVLYFPMWRIDLDAPQYPEGLSLKIHATDIKGDIAIINGLNHYIGMRTLHKEDFPEFQILPFCIVFFVVLFIAVGIANKRNWLYGCLLLFVIFGIVAMADFWRWEYNYGHNLDPNAAIIVPGMAYQPPLIGFKQLLNFGAYSIPDIGGWIFIGCGALLLVTSVIEWKKAVKMKKMALTTVFAIIALTGFSGCNTNPEPIRVGKDICAYCKMTIADPRFGAELVTRQGRVYKFDDIRCMTDYLKLHDETKVAATIYFTDFCGAHSLIPSGNSILLNSADLKAPMQGHLIAFSSLDSLDLAMGAYGGEKTSWALQ